MSNFDRVSELLRQRERYMEMLSTHGTSKPIDISTGAPSTFVRMQHDSRVRQIVDANSQLVVVEAELRQLGIELGE